MFEVSNMIRSMCGLDIPLISVGHSMAKLVQNNKKRFIIINARTHSGESSASWVMDGFLKELTSNKDICEWMLNEGI